MFCLRVLEKYSDQDYSLLLGCSRQDIGETRIRALLHVGESDRQRTMPGAAFEFRNHEEAQTQEV
jgi:hypothetical protein